MDYRTINDETAQISILRTTEYETVYPITTNDRENEFMAIFETIKNEKYWDMWTNNSSKSAPPPDYYSDELGLMMELMQVDDHSSMDGKHVINKTKIRESELLKEITNPGDTHDPYAALTKFIIADSGLPTFEDHSYDMYLSDFKRVIEKHKKHIELYRKNHPEHKLIFLIFDGSSAYVHLKKRTLRNRYLSGAPVKDMEVHNWFSDSNFIKILEGMDVDYILWFTPYKHIPLFDRDNEFKHFPLPNLCIFDPKEKITTLDYDADCILPCEK